MSGPKSSSYYVESAAEIERRNLAQARSRLTRAQAAGRAVQAEADKVAAAYGVRLATLELAPAAHAHSSAVNAQAAALEQATAALRAETAREREAARRAVVAAIADPAGVAEHHARVDDGARAEVDGLNEAARTAASEAQRRDRAAQAATLVDRLTAEAPMAVMETVVELASRYVEADDAAAASLLVELRDAVSRENGLAVDRATAAAAAALVLPLLDGVESAEAEALRAEMEAAVASGSSVRAEARAEAEAIAAAWVVNGDTTYAAGVIADGLQSLGYFVEEGFETLVVGDDGALVVSSEGDHGVRVVRGDNGRLVFTPVALMEDTTAEQQTAFEHTFCTDYATITREAASRGVRLGLEVDMPAGQGVEHRLAKATTAKAGPEQRRKVPRERARKL